LNALETAVHARAEVMERETIYLKEEHARTVTQLQHELHVAKAHAESAIDELDVMDAHHTTAINKTTRRPCV